MQRAIITSAILAAALLAAAPARSLATTPPPADTGIRLLLIGLDAADWQIAGPLIDAGRMPNLAGLRKRGAWGDLKSSPPMLSPLLWTSIATGKPPGDHGIIDFLIRDPRTGKNVPISSSLRKTKALWNIYTEAGRSTDFVGWWATWPAEAIKGHMVSERMAYSLFGFQSRPEDTAGLVYPPDFLPAAQALRVDESTITLKDLQRFARVSEADLAASRAKLQGDRTQAYADPLNHLVRILASTRTYHAIALKLLREGRSDLVSVYFQGIDEVCHRFGQFIPPKLPWVDQESYDKYRDVVTRFYEYQDSLLGDLLAAAGSQMTVVVVSDHGFLNGSDRPDFPPDIELKAGRWHRLYGIVVLSGPGIQPGRMEPASLYDVTPTLLYLSGLPVPADMAGRPVLDAIQPSFQRRFPLASVATYEDPGGRHVEEISASGASSSANDEIMARLRSLGYIGSGEAAGDQGAAPAAIPATLTNLFNLATLQLSQGDLAHSEENLRAILAKLPDHGESHTLLSEVLQAQGRLEESAGEARTAINLMPDPPESLFVRYAQIAHRTGSTDDARSFFLRYAQLHPGSSHPWLGLGYSQAMAGDLKGAEASFLRALEKSPRSSAVVTGLFNVYERGERSTEILAALEKAVAINPDSAANRTLLGMIYSKAGQKARAEVELRKALDLAPDLDAALGALADVLVDTKRLDDARVLLERAIARRADQAEVRMSLGRVYSKMRRLGEAARQMSEAVRLDPTNPSPHAQLGILLTMQDQGERAVGHLERALQLDPSLYDVRLHLAVLYHELRKAPECEAQLKAAVEQRPADPEPRRLLVELYSELGRRDDAEREMARLKELTSSTKP